MVWLPSEEEIVGKNYWNKLGSERLWMHFPIYQKSLIYRIKKENGIRSWYWEGSPYEGTIQFCRIVGHGDVGFYYASDEGGISPAFCVA
jgi:hypothetical protein